MKKESDQNYENFEMCRKWNQVAEKKISDRKFS